MFDFLKNAPAKTAMTLDQAADLLGTNPETLAAFDAAGEPGGCRRDPGIAH